MIRNIRNPIQVRVYQVHGKQEERIQAYYDDWEAVGAKADSRESNQIHGQTVPRRMERQALTVESNSEQGHALQETDTTFIYNQSSLPWRIGQLDSDLRSQESGVLGVGPTPDSEISPFFVCLPVAWA